MKWQDGNITAQERLDLKAQYKIRGKEVITTCSTCHR
jgi:hypothetical protein